MDMPVLRRGGNMLTVGDCMRAMDAALANLEAANKCEDIDVAGLASVAMAFIDAAFAVAEKRANASYYVARAIDAATNPRWIHL
jgi:hypothetical protein